MPNAKADRLLSRLSALHRSLRLDDSAPSAMERDLMLGYLRQLYDAYLEADTETAEAPAPKLANTSPPAPAPTPPPPPPPAPEPIPAPSVPKVPVPPPPPPAMAENTAVVQPSYTTPAPNPPQPQPAPTTNSSVEIEELFAVSDSGDLAGQLGRSAISDLTRSLSINNRVLFSNTLFGSNNDLLNTVLRELNQKGSMAVAKPTLVDLAQRYDWTAEARRDVARDFIELVRRRYA